MPNKSSNNKTLWLVVIALLAVVAVIFILNPTRGEDEAALEAVAQEAAIDRDDTLSDYPVEAEPMDETAEEGDVVLDVPQSEETGALGEEQLQDAPQ
ncbi:hypothetical protein [Aurantiacibacter hainanensis]|uniref:hypothetical protein n=1 Tax=Aurantiacibacter hainanensis TaxID=3076114 RepID=UPI0030C7710F